MRINEAKVEPSANSNEKNWKKFDNMIKTMTTNNKTIEKGLQNINKTIEKGFKDLIAEIRRK